MNDAAGVDSGHGGGGSADDLDGVAHAEGSASLALGEVFAVEPFHGEEEASVMPASMGDVLDDVGVA
jgi:hypothetical protein